MVNSILIAVRFGIVLCSLLLIFPEFVRADAKVDGFFRENFVSEGHFSEVNEIREVNSGSPQNPTFFISREERRLNPNKAPSNNLQIPQRRVRINTQTLAYPTSWGRGATTIGTIYSK